MIPSNPLLGTAFHAIGALSSSACYAPQKKVRKWSWQTYWLTQAAFCWFLLPIIGAALTIPNLRQVLAEAPREAMLVSFLLGMAYGVGGTAFNISIRYIGFSLTYAIAVGLSSILGTLLTPLIQHRFGAFLYDLLWTGRLTQPLDYGALEAIFSKRGADLVLSGVAIGALGIAICGVAGRLKEKNLQGDKAQGEFSLAKGLLISLPAGVLSAFYSFSLDAGQPIADVATNLGAGVWGGNVIYIFSNTGAFVTTAIYCLYLHARHRTLGELIELPAGPEKANLPLNFAMAALTGLLWYGQFFFYNLGHVQMGDYKFSSWAIHMIMLVLFSNLIAVLFREWTGCRRSTQFAVALALTVLVVAVVVITYGNKLGAEAAGNI